jgi:site-specific DNA-adenine methylase
MFYYYGRKKKIAGLYPDPILDSDFIIEPFAGSGAYSLFGNRWEKQVLLYDTNIIVYKIWNYLLQASIKDIESLPILQYRDDLRNYQLLSEEEKYIIGFAINPGSVRPGNIATKFSRWNANKKYIIDNLYKIKHWKIYNQSFETINNMRSTWFIDPPYFKEGIYYNSNLDYNFLSNWCMDRIGLQIVCESDSGNWLPFQELCTITAIGKRKPKEYVYINYLN